MQANPKENPRRKRVPLRLLRNKDKTTLINEYLQKALLEHCYSQNKVAIITSIICASFILYALYDSKQRILVLGCYAFILLVSFIRYVINRLYYLVAAKTKSIQLWRNLFILGSFLSGISWGLFSVILIPTASHPDQLLIILIIAGVSAGAVPALAAIPASAISFLIAALLPIICYLISETTGIYRIFGYSCFFYLVYLIAVGSRHSQFVKRTILLQFDNQRLLEKLSKQNNELEYIALHDPLTEVANRHLFEINLSNAIKRAQRNRQYVALVYLDLDNFKNINDQYGHHIGDELLLLMADKLKANLRSIDMISRMGGDEFTVILEGNKDLKDIKKTVKKIFAVISEPMTIKGIKLKISASIGVSIYPLDASNAEILLKIADTAMYYAKKTGRSNIKYHIDTK